MQPSGSGSRREGNRPQASTDGLRAGPPGSRAPRTRGIHLAAISSFLIATLTACGGGGGSSGGGGNPPPVGQIDSVSLTARGSTSPVPSVSNTELEFTITNPGSTAASNVVLTVTLGTGLAKAGLQCTATGGAICPDDARTLSVASLPGGASVTFTFGVTVDAGATGSITSSGSVTAANDQVTSNNSAQVSITAYSADVRVLGSVAADELRKDSIATYSFTVANAGPDAARDVALKYALSSAQTITNAQCTASDGATCPATITPDMVVPLLPSGSALKISVTARLTADALVAVSGTLTATLRGDGARDNNKANISAKTSIPTSVSTPSFVELRSDAGDNVGSGVSATGTQYSYTRQNAVFTVIAVEGVLRFEIRADHDWTGWFKMPVNLLQLEPGQYHKIPGLPYGSDDNGGFEFVGSAAGCGADGWFIIDNAVYAQGELVRLDLRFEEHCNDREAALRGQLHWVVGDESRPPGPVNPPPPGLWNAPAGATPSSGNYVYLASDAGDFIGQGRTELFTQANAVLTVKQDSGVLIFAVLGDRDYSGHFQAMAPLTRVEPGYYGEAQTWPFGNPAVGRLNVGGVGRGCDVNGWFVIDSLSFSGDAVTGLDLRFEQHCGSATPALRGKIHWRADDPTIPDGPQVPPPSGLWSPPAQAIPATGNVVYLESDRGDFIGQGLAKAYTPLNSVIVVGDNGMGTAGNRFDLSVHSDEWWNGSFQAMYTLPDLQAGYYGHAARAFVGNPAFGNLDWFGEGRGCNELAGWFVIDSVTYTGSSLSAIELRFEQHCDRLAAALHGYIRWSASDLRTPPPPQNPPPPNLWAPPSGATPANGNYFYFESDPDDFIGQGQKRLLKAPATTFDLTTEGSQLNVTLQDAALWQGYIVPMVPLTQLQVGYYGNVTQFNDARGLINWSAYGRGCDIATAWFVVDNVAYTAGALTAIDVRFEQRCKSSTGSLRGKLHWRSSGP